MRLMFKIGFVPDPDRVKRLEASADNSEHPGARWFGTAFDLKGIVAVIGLISAMVGMHVSSSNQIATLANDQKYDAARLDQHAAQLSDCVKRSSYEHDTTQLDITLGSLEAGQQQIFNLMVQGSGAQRPLVLGAPLRSEP